MVAATVWMADEMGKKW